MSSGRRVIAKNNVASIVISDIEQEIMEQLKNHSEEIDKLLDDVASYVHSEAVNTTRFKDKTGTLRRSIKKFKSRFKDGGYIVHIGAPHASLIEYGHFGRDGKWKKGVGFLRDALEKGKAYAAQKIARIKG